VAEAYAAHVLDVYEHYRWRWRLQAPIRELFQRLKTEHPNEDAGELWERAIAEAGPGIIQTAWQSLTVDDTWQDYYQTHKDQLAAEANFWSAFGGEALAPGGGGRRRHRRPR
jgi:hypothetical protein